MIPFEWLEQARARIKSHIRLTPLLHDAARKLYIKWENQQETGSFKLRGAFNKIMSLEEWELKRGLVCASAGNHGQAVALAANRSGVLAEVFASENIPTVKLEKMRDLGATLHIVKGGYGEAEKAGLDYAADKGKTWISPYNDGLVIAGQGTIALEILEQLTGSEPVVWIVPVGGGGLISGIGSALAQVSPRPRLIGAQPQDNAYMYNLFHDGTQADWQDLSTLADGLSGSVEEGSVTIPMVKQSVDEILLVSEEEIARAIAFAWHTYHEVIEGSSAAALALFLSRLVEDRPALVLITGGNIAPEMHARIRMDWAGESWG